MTTNTESGVHALLTALRVLNSLADDRTSYTARGEEVTDFTPLAVRLIVADTTDEGEAPQWPDPAHVERVEEQLTQLFLSAHILSRVYTNLDV